MTKELMIEDFTQTGDILVTEASSVGLAPGEWPDRIEITSKDGSISLLTFDRFEESAQGELLAAVYVDKLNRGFMEAHILND